MIQSSLSTGKESSIVPEQEYLSIKVNKKYTWTTINQNEPVPMQLSLEQIKENENNCPMWSVSENWLP